MEVTFPVSVIVNDTKGGEMTGVYGARVDDRGRLQFLDESGTKIRNWDGGLRHYGVPRGRTVTFSVSSDQD
jgi:hypothetical protein